MYLFVRGFFRVMYLYQGPGGFDLGEKLDYKLVLRDLAGKRGVVFDISTHLFPRSSARERSDDCQVDDGVDACESGDG